MRRTLLEHHPPTSARGMVVIIDVIHLHTIWVHVEVSLVRKTYDESRFAAMNFDMITVRPMLSRVTVLACGSASSHLRICTVAKRGMRILFNELSF